MELKGSRTEKCLMDAFTGECKAHMKYIYFASVAKKAGFEQISAIFSDTSANEKEHAERCFKFLGLLGDTAANLKDAISGEHFETSSMYPEFAKIAEEEGFKDIAYFFTETGEVEAEHEKRYQKLLGRVETDTVFKSDVPVKWRCRNCGYVHEGLTPPELCPSCAHPIAYYERMAENY